MDASVINHEIRKSIFKKLMYSKALTFSQLQDGKIPSNHFNYHLKELIKLGVVKKQGNLYSLTKEADELTVYFDTQNLEVYEPPFAGVAVLLRKDDKMLISRLEKEPFKNCWMMSAVGRLKKGEGLQDSAYRQTVERTGYIPQDLELKVVHSIRTYQKNKLLSQHLHFTFKCSKFKGNFKEKSTDRTNKWIRIKDLRKYNIFLEIPTTMKYMDKPGITYLEIKRVYNGKKFTSSKVLLSQTI